MPGTKHVSEPSPYAGPVICLRCDKGFESWDRRQNKLCPRCREYIEGQPSAEPLYQVGIP